MVYDRRDVEAYSSRNSSLASISVLEIPSAWRHWRFQYSVWKERPKGRVGSEGNRLRMDPQKISSALMGTLSSHGMGIIRICHREGLAVRVGKSSEISIYPSYRRALEGA